MVNEDIGFPIKLFMIGFIIIFIGVILLFISVLSKGLEGEVSAVGIVMIGPIPIIWGGGPHYLELTVIGLIVLVIILAILLMFLPRRIISY